MTLFLGHFFSQIEKKYQFSITFLGLNYFVFNIYIVKKDYSKK